MQFGEDRVQIGAAWVLGLARTYEGVIIQSAGI